jgi:transposase-like protein
MARKQKVERTPQQIAKRQKYQDLVTAMLRTKEGQEVLRNRDPEEPLTGPGGLIPQMVAPVIQEMLDAELDQFLGYGKYESPAYLGEKTNGSRNGSYNRKLKTMEDGEFSVRIPRDKDGNFKPTVVKPYKQITPDLEQKIISLYAMGTSTRDIMNFIYESYGFEISEGFVTKVTDKILDLAKEWQVRALKSVYPIIYLDAVHINCRDNSDSHKVVKKAVHIVLGYDIEGKKEILGQYISQGGEGAKFWLSVVQDLQNRGVKDVMIACVDGLTGFPEAINSVFSDTIVQRCVIHAIRNSLKYIPNKLAADFMEDLKPVYKADTRVEAEENLEILKNNWEEKYPMAVRVWTKNWEQLSTYFDWTKPIRKMIYTTNPIESFNSIIRKYTKNKRSFPNDDALRKVLYLAEQKATEKWDKAHSDWATVLNQFAIQFGDRLGL